MRDCWLKSWTFGLGLASAMIAGHAKCMAADFYAGKTVTITVGFSAGGVYDQMARLYARHLGHFLPGHPTVVVQNQPGAGSLVTANNLARLWAGDATRLGVIGSGSVWQPILGDKQAPYDPRSLAWIGGRTRDTLTCAIWHESPTSTLADARNRETIVGSTGPGSITFAIPKALNELAGARLKIVAGYPGGVEIEMAMAKGEVEGYCGWAFGAAKRTASYRSNKLKFLAQFADKPNHELPHIPLATEIASDEIGRQVMSFISSAAVLQWPLLGPAGLDPQRIVDLRQGFDAMLRDPSVLAEAEQNMLEIAPISGQDLQSLVETLTKTPEDVLAFIRRINEIR